LNIIIKFIKLSSYFNEETTSEAVHEVIFQKAISVTVKRINTLLVKEKLPGADVRAIKLAVMVEEVLCHVGDNAIRLDGDGNHQRKHEVIFLAVGKELGETCPIGSNG